MRALVVGSVQRAVALGSFLRFFAYTTVDLTCLALRRNFPVIVVVVDLPWGTVLTASAGAVGYGIGRWPGIPG